MNFQPTWPNEIKNLPGGGRSPTTSYNPENSTVVTPITLRFWKHLIEGYHHPISNDRPNCPPCRLQWKKSSSVKHGIKNHQWVFTDKLGEQKCRPNKQTWQKPAVFLRMPRNPSLVELIDFLFPSARCFEAVFNPMDRVIERVSGAVWDFQVFLGDGKP